MLEMRGICKSYRKNAVLTGADIVLREGECVGLVGANGVGKSTLLKILVGGLKADDGEIFFNGEPTDPQELSERVGYVPQEHPLFDDLTVKDNLELWYRGDKAKLAEDLKQGILNKFGIGNFYKKRVSKLSGGMKKRLSICCALASDPDVLVLDEPGAALDLSAKQLILNLIREFTNRGKSVIITSHELPELTLCDRLYGIKDGVATQLEEKIDSFYLQQWMEN